MNKSKLGFITPGGLIGLAISGSLILSAIAIVGYQIFSPGELNQQTTGIVLGGVRTHGELTQNCQACHPAPWTNPGQNALCLDCHQDIVRQLGDSQSLHGAIQSAGLLGMCRDCHTEHNGPAGPLTDYSGEDFPHELMRFSLTAHSMADWEREITCQDCHPESLQSFGEDACQSCHAEINDVFYAAHVKDFGSNCLACHDGLETITREYPHDQGGFPLTGAHTSASCSSCHAGAGDLDQFKQVPTECAACHADHDAHDGGLGELCEECHSTSGWTPAIFDHEITGFPLTFGHARPACSDCHQELAFQEVSPICSGCHEKDDPHQQLFGDSCDLCHNTIRWDYVTFDHTGPYLQFCSACHLDDKPANHYQGECSACHQIAAWIPASFDHAVAGAVDCLSCHLADKPINHFPGQCSFCHKTSSWLPASFSHTFPLSHGSANSDCSRCHATANYYSYTCYLCHEHNRSEIKKEHEGVSNLDNCVRCHWDGRKHDDGSDDD